MNLYVLEYQGINANGMIVMADSSIESLSKNLKVYLKSFFSSHDVDYYRTYDWVECGEEFEFKGLFNEAEFDANFEEDFRLVAKKYATIPRDDQEDNVWTIESEFELRMQLQPGVYNFAFRRQQ